MEGGEAGVVAVTKVFAIRVRLDDRVRYITDGEKTSLASSITYISNPEKTEQFFFTSALNCSSVDTALSEMMETKQQFGKMGGVLGYHSSSPFSRGRSHQSRRTLSGWNLPSGCLENGMRSLSAPI